MAAMLIRTLDTTEEVQTLEGLLVDYIRYVCDDLQRHAGVSFDQDALISNTMKTLHKVVPPEGRTFVAETADGDALGMVFLRKSTAEAMEIKRLFVRPEGRGTGAGRALVEAAMAEARAMGSSIMRLDSSRTLKAAIALYRSLGFKYCDPYPESDHYNDDELSDVLIFMEKRLTV